MMSVFVTLLMDVGECTIEVVRFLCNIFSAIQIELSASVGTIEWYYCALQRCNDNEHPQLLSRQNINLSHSLHREKPELITEDQLLTPMDHLFISDEEPIFNWQPPPTHTPAPVCWLK